MAAFLYVYVSFLILNIIYVSQFIINAYYVSDLSVIKSI
jgi:hypothetical protein